MSNFFRELFSFKVSKKDKLLKLSKVNLVGNKSLFYLYLILSTKLAVIDGSINKEELLFIYKNKVQWGNFPIDETDIKLALEDRKEILHYASLVKKIIDDRRILLKMIKSLIKLANCDGYLKNIEYNTLISVAKILDFDNSFIDDLVKKELNILNLDLDELFGRDNSKYALMYKQLAKKFHPDKFLYLEDISTIYIEEVTQRFNLIQKFYHANK